MIVVWIIVGVFASLIAIMVLGNAVTYLLTIDLTPMQRRAFVTLSQQWKNETGSWPKGLNRKTLAAICRCLSTEKAKAIYEGQVRLREIAASFADESDPTFADARAELYLETKKRVNRMWGDDDLSQGAETSRSKTYELPEDVLVPVTLLMQAADILVTYHDDDLDIELGRRQRAAACAYGATDWLCKAKNLSIDEPDWWQATVQVMSHFFPTDVWRRAGAERVGALMGEIGKGNNADLNHCIEMGAQAMRRWAVQQDTTAPADVAMCIMQWPNEDVDASDG